MAPTRYEFEMRHHYTLAGLASLILALVFLNSCTQLRSQIRTAAEDAGSDSTQMAAAPSRNSEFRHLPLGLCDDYPEETTKPSKIRRDFAVLKDLGITHFRFAFGWDAIETAPGAYDWHFWDSVVQEAEKNGIHLIPYVTYTPEWAARTATDAWRQPPRDPAAFADFVEVLVRRYPQIRTWELWNEPDNQNYWLGTAAEFAKMFKLAALRVRKTNPQARIVFGGFAQITPFAKKVLLDHDLASFVDVVNLHGYHETWEPETTEDYPKKFSSLKKIIDRSKARPEMWLAEFGYSGQRFDARRVSAWVERNYAHEHTPQYQAVVLWRHHILARASGLFSLLAWFRINDLKPTEDVIGDGNNRSLGLLDVKGRPKPAYHALKFHARLFQKPVRAVTDFRITAGPEAEPVVHIFEREDGSVLVTAWLPSSRLEDIEETSGNILDTRTEVIEIELSGRDFSQLAVFDVEGRHLQSDPSKLDGSNLRQIRLTGPGIYIAELQPKRPRNEPRTSTRTSPAN